MSQQQIKENLARTLGINAGDILDFSPIGGGCYNVITFNYQKFVGIEPTEPEPEPKPEKKPAAKRTRARKTTTKK